MDELELILADFDESQMSELLNDIEAETDIDLSERIKAQVIPAIDKESEKKIRFFTPRRIFMLAASFVAVVCTAIAINMYYKPAEVELTTTETTRASTSDYTVKAENPLMLAISSGNDSLIDILINNTLFLTNEVLNFAIECADSISYESIQKIASATLETLGETGLDGLLESTLLGDSKRALEELKKRENMLMTPMERLSFFFSVAFCDSEVVKEFINRGYDSGITNERGETLFQIAREYGNEENAEYVSELAEE